MVDPQEPESQAGARVCGHTLSHAPPYILAAALGVSWREGNRQVRTPHVLKSMPHGEYFASKERPHLFMLFVCCLPAGARWLYTVFLPIQNTRLMGPASAGMGAGDGGGCLSSPCWWSRTNARAPCEESPSCPSSCGRSLVKHGEPGTSAKGQQGVFATTVQKGGGLCSCAGPTEWQWG